MSDQRWLQRDSVSQPNRRDVMGVSIETQRLLLTPFQEADIEELAEVMADPDVMKHIGIGALNVEQVTAIVARAVKQWDATGMGWWTIRLRETKHLIGQICLKPASDLPDVEVGFALRVAQWNLGYATEALSAAIDHGTKVLNLKRIVATVRPENARSIALLERCGFRLDRTIWLREKYLKLYVLLPRAPV